MTQYRLVVFSLNTAGDLVRKTVGRDTDTAITDVVTGMTGFSFNRKDTARNAVKRVRRLQKNREGLRIRYALTRFDK